MNIAPATGALDRFFRTQLARASGVLFAASLVAGMLGYGFQVLMGRMLSTADYGLFSALMAIYAVGAAPLGTLMMVVSRRVSEYNAANRASSISHLYAFITARSAIVGVALLAGGYFLAPWLAEYLRARSLTAVYWLEVLLVISILPIINNAFLQGLQSFNWLSASNTLAVGLKILFAGLLVALGTGVSGALAGCCLAALLAWLITCWPLRGNIPARMGSSHEGSHLRVAASLPVLLANVSFAAMTQLDMVVVNYYFPPEEASQYAAASVLGKAVMYLPGGIAMALFPMVAERQARGESSAKLFVQAVLLTAIFCGLASLGYLVVGEWLVRIFYGEAYAPAGALLRGFGFAMLPTAMILVAEYFLIAKGRVLFAYLFVIAAPLQVGALALFHQTLESVVLVLGLCNATVMLAGYGLLWGANQGRWRPGKAAS